MRAHAAPGQQRLLRATAAAIQQACTTPHTHTLAQVGLAACAYGGEVLGAVEAALADAFHEVNVQGCACVGALVGEAAGACVFCAFGGLPAGDSFQWDGGDWQTALTAHAPPPAASLGMRLQPMAKRLAAALLPLTTHKRHRVRVAALRALGPLVHQARALAGACRCAAPPHLPSASWPARAGERQLLHKAPHACPLLQPSLIYLPPN